MIHLSRFAGAQDCRFEPRIDTHERKSRLSPDLVPNFPLGTAFFAADLASAPRFCHLFLQKQFQNSLLQNF
jgi:hypothetical protein